MEQITPDEQVLRSLGLSPQDYQEVKAEQERKRQESLLAARQQGNYLYQELNNMSGIDITSIPLGGNFFIKLSQAIGTGGTIVDRMEAVIKQISDVMALSPDEQNSLVTDSRGDPVTSGRLEDTSLRLRYLLEGLGQATIQKGHWGIYPAGLKALHIASPGGIINNPDALNLIKTKFTGNNDVLAFFAEQIQTLTSPQPPQPNTKT